MAILWHEMWHEALEEASRMYFGEQNVEGMLNVLAPLHAIMERQGAETLQEISFVQVLTLTLTLTLGSGFGLAQTLTLPCCVISC